MKKNTKTLNDRLAQFNITPENYENKCKQLQELGFSEQQANQLIIRRSSSYATYLVIDKTKRLLEPPYQLTHQQIIQIAAQRTGYHNLRAIIKAFPHLKDLEFTTEQIIKVVARPGGSNNIEALIEHYPSLIGYGYSRHNILAMASHKNNGAKIIRGCCEDEYKASIGEVINSGIFSESKKRKIDEIRVDSDEPTLLNNLSFS